MIYRTSLTSSSVCIARTRGVFNIESCHIFWQLTWTCYHFVEWGLRWGTAAERGYLNPQLSRSLFPSFLHRSRHKGSPNSSSTLDKTRTGTLCDSHLVGTYVHERYRPTSSPFNKGISKWAHTLGNNNNINNKKITRMIVSTSMLVLGSRSSHSDSSELFVSLCGSMKRKKENKRLEERLVRQGRAAQELWAAWKWVTAQKMLKKNPPKQTKPKPKTKQGKQRHAFAKEKRQWFCKSFR